MPRKKPAPRSRSVKNQSVSKVSNGLSEAILGFNPGSIGTQLSQVDTIFINNRWYLISNMRQVLSESYVEHGLLQTIVNVPVDDGMRGGVGIKSKQLDPEQVEDLQIYLEREDLLSSVVGRALKWNRLFGGAGIIILTEQDPIEPLDLNLITSDTKLEYRAVDMWELFWDKQNVEGYNPALQEHEFEHYNYYGMRLHKSRVMPMKGLVAPSFIRPRLRGWGFSVVESFVQSINQYLKSKNLTFEVLDEFKVDFYKIKGLAQTLLDADGTQQVQKRVALANQQKNFQNAVTMDSEDDFGQKQISFAGIAEVQKELRMQIASDMRMPITKIFGVSSAGFSSGEDDIENYNAMVESEVRAKCKFEILKILELRCQQEWGYIPDDLQIEFKPLRILSAVDEENVKTQKFNRVLQARQAGEISSMEFRDQCNKDALLPVQLDTEELELQEESAADQGTDQSEANKSESQKAIPMKNADPSGGFKLEYNSLHPEAQLKLLDDAKGVIQNPGHVDESLWEKAKKASQEAFGQIKYGFVQYLYRKWGGS